MSGTSGVGVGSMVEELRRVVVGRPAPELATADPALWHYDGEVDYELALEQHAELTGILGSLGVEVLVCEDSGGSADAMFVHDPVTTTPAGFVTLRPGKALRRGEAPALARFLEDAGVPRAGEMQRGFCEGGDLLWLDPETLLVGVGYRTDAVGVDELRRIVGPLGVEVEAFDLPAGQGADACLHLQSLVSLVDHDLAVVHSPLTPVRLLQRLAGRGIELLEAPEEEMPSQATNVLCIRPRVALALDANVQTIAQLRDRGCEVHTYRGTEISLKTEGGPTCLTRPIWRCDGAA